MIENTEQGIYGLRKAVAEDVEFLFRVSTEAMSPVDKALNPHKVFDKDAEMKVYQSKFIPEEIDIITYQGEDVGRLRVVRDGKTLYVGGIQILPHYQGKGIGTALFTDLISESDATGCPITLEVHDVNSDARRFYTRLGFEDTGHEGNKTCMTYNPK